MDYIMDRLAQGFYAEEVAKDVEKLLVELDKHKVSEMFTFDVSANELLAPTEHNNPFGNTVRKLVDEWVGAFPSRLNHPRIGTAVGYRDGSNTFCVKLVFRHSQSLPGVANGKGV